jgi:pSer/pThr/pTyr-binding forkhead associated (FHA) protein
LLSHRAAGKKRAVAKLTIIAENGERNAHELTEEIVTVGRAPDNVIAIDDPSVSGRHAQLQLTGDSYQLRDLGSTNGTRVNGELVTETMLRIGDRLRFGKIEARFESEAVGDAQPLPDVEVIGAQPAIASARPADFANASPFPRRRNEKDAVRTALLAAAAIAFLAFVGSMVAVFTMHAPAQ